MSFAPNPSHSCISRIAGAQGGFVEREQLLDSCGLTRGAVEGRLRAGSLIAVYRGVYAVGHVPTEPRARAWAAILAVGDRSALAGRSAASFYGVFRSWREPFAVITPENRRPTGVNVHQCRTLLTRDIWRFDGLAVTSPARTALDLATRMSDRRLHGAVDHLRLRHHLTREQLADILARNPRHSGARALARVAGLLSANSTRSEFEREWPVFARRFGITGYEMNARVAGYEVDVLIPGSVIVELDTLETHLLNFDSDRRRDARILAARGMPTLRFMWDRFRAEPESVAAEIRTVVAQRRARPAAPQSG